MAITVMLKKRLTKIDCVNILYIYNMHSMKGVMHLNILISYSSSKPIYTQIVDQIKKQILMGKLEDGYAMPSIRVLAKELHVSVITTKNAYQLLENEGLLESVPGKGFYVKAQSGEVLKEKKLELIERKLEEIIEESKALDITFDKLIEIMKLMY